jgi:hypothetical protein
MKNGSCIDESDTGLPCVANPNPDFIPASVTLGIVSSE